jgi:hypothetical protein
MYWIVERAKGNCDQVRIIAAAVVNGRAALRAEVVGRGLAAVGRPGPLPGRTLDLDAFGRPARLGGEDAPGALLAGEAVTDRDADRIPMRHGAELAAAA